MTSPDALDYSWSRPSPAALRNAGIRLVARYLSHDDSKDLSAAEANALHSAGIGVLLNWESEAGRPLLGANAGAQDGRDAAARAESRGAPHGLTIYYSCDTNTTAAQWPTIAAYYRAAGAATAGQYKVGVYGEADLIDYLHRSGVVTSEWQTYAWSNGRQSAEADLYQYLNGQSLAGASVDFDRIIHPALLGAWWPNGETPLGGGVPITGVEMLEASDPIVVGIESKLDRLLAQTATANSGVTVAGQQEEHNDILNTLKLVGSLATQLGAVAANDTALAASVADVKTQLGHLATGTATVDPVALAQAIAGHVKLVAS